MGSAESITRQVLHVDCDCFFASVEMRDRPELKSLPLAIGGAKDRRGVISTCNYVARKYGVRSAMPTAHALQLCPDLKLMPGNMEKYRTVSQEVMAILRDYGSQFQQVSIDEAYLELPPFSNGELVARQIREQVEHELGITVSIGIAPNKFLAKVSSDWNKPNGQFMVAPWEVDGFVAALPIRKIPGVGPKSAEKLHNMGIERCEHLREFTLTDLLNQFGKFGKLLFDRSRGVDPRALSVGGDRKSISIERTYPEDLKSEAEIVAALDGLWERFENRVAGAKTQPQHLAPYVKLKYFDFQVMTLANHELACSRESYATLLKSAFAKNGKPVRLVGLGGRLKLQDIDQLAFDFNFNELDAP